MTDLLDLLTFGEAKEAINRDTTNQDDASKLARHVTAVSRRIDDRCGPVVRRAVSEVLEGGEEKLRLSKVPASSITLVRESNGGSIQTITGLAFGDTGTGYRAAPWRREPGLLNGELTRVGSCRWADEVEVTYVAGRYANTAAVDARFKDAAGAVLRRLWKREAGAWAQSSEFWEDQDSNAGTGFYRVADPIIDEMLGSDRIRNGIL